MATVALHCTAHLHRRYLYATEMAQDVRAPHQQNTNINKQKHIKWRCNTYLCRRCVYAAEMAQHVRQ
jgi:hypothetical protein